MAEQRAIGLAVDTVGSYGREVIHGVMEFCHRNPHWVIGVEPRLWRYDSEPQPATDDVEGIIVQAADAKVIQQLIASGKPVINVTNLGAASKRLPTIAPDDEAIGRLGAGHLLSLGVEHYGAVAHNSYEFSKARIGAFTKEIEASGAKVHLCDTAQTTLAGLVPWLNSLPKPAAVFCCNDVWAHRTLAAARRAGLRVPEQVAVLGVDDDELLNTIGALPLSSISVSASKIGFEAARMLEAALDGKKPPMFTKVAPLAVVPRATTNVFHVDDPDVAEALAYIKANSGRPIGVDDVLNHVSMSRRSLERRFRAAVGRSVAVEIRRSHLERAKQLLANTTLTIEEVALASGFTNTTLLGVVFRRYVGESPSNFRARGEISPKQNMKLSEALQRG